jgi:cation/acetate symporter
VWASDGAADPTSAAPASWSVPLASPGGGIGLYTTYSLIVATFLGTMGLPHVVVRFYTNPDGRAARRTTLAVLVLLGVFYVLPPLYAALGRIYAPDLISGRSDVLVLELPNLMVDGLLGAVLTGLVTAGAFAAFLSTSSGLTIAVAGVLSQDVTGRRWGSYRLGGVAAFRVAAAIAVVVPLLLSLPAQDVAVARTVGLAFAVTASTFGPLLMLGIWWRGLTPVGAVAGLLVGGLGSGAAVAWTLAVSPTAGWTAALLGQPAAWSVPASLATMVVVSKLTAASVPAHAGRFMVRLHTPEAVDLQR